MIRIKKIPFYKNPEREFGFVVHAYEEKVIRFISLFVLNNEECEELASDVFVSLWINRLKLAEIDDINSYIFIVAKNKALNHIRNRRTNLVDLDTFQVDAFQNTETTPESIYITHETVDELNSAINELPQKTKLAFHLVREDKMKYKEAAVVLGVSIKTIEKQVASAVAKLREKLSK